MHAGVKEQVMDELGFGLGLISIHQQQTMDSSRPLRTPPATREYSGK
jgi:hypothetical protein